MRPLAVVMLTPSLDDPRGLGEQAVPVLVQALIPEPAGLDEAQPYPGPCRPGKECPAGPRVRAAALGRLRLKRFLSLPAAIFEQGK